MIKGVTAAVLVLAGRYFLALEQKSFWTEAYFMTGLYILAFVLVFTAYGPVAGLVGIEGGVVSGVINLESSGVEAPDWRPRHDKHYHEARVVTAPE